MTLTAVKTGQWIFRSATVNDRAAITVWKRAGKGRSRFALPEGHMTHVRTTLYRSREDRDAALLAQLASVEQSRAMKAAQRAERAKPHSFKVGDILYTSWGYDQTNIDFYVVTSTTPHTIDAAPIAQTTNETGFMCGDTMPVMPVETRGESKRYRANAHGVSIGGHYTGMWDGKAKRSSWYA